jgi:uncharacterized damage-inducible protein DinB
MTPEYCQALGRYNRWMNESLYATCATLSEEERKRDRGAFFKSIHATLNHLLLADRVWMGRLTSAALAEGEIGPGIRTLDQELHADFDELRASRAEMDEVIHRFATELTLERLAATVRFFRMGVVNELPTWWAVGQMFNHQTHHRGQVTTLLMQAGRDPGVTDLIAMLRSE